MFSGNGPKLSCTHILCEPCQVCGRRRKWLLQATFSLVLERSHCCIYYGFVFLCPSCVWVWACVFLLTGVATIPWTVVPGGYAQTPWWQSGAGELCKLCVCTFHVSLFVKMGCILTDRHHTSWGLASCATLCGVNPDIYVNTNFCHYVLKETPSQDSRYPENGENGQIFPSAGFLWWVCHCLYDKSTVLLKISAS